MAQVIDGSDALFDSLAYGERHIGTHHFLQSQMENISHLAGSAGQRFYESAQQMYDRFNNSNVARYARAAKRAFGSAFQGDGVRRLSTVGEIQHAPPVMRRWIMAEPTVRRMYHNQQLEGYSGGYVDQHPGQIGVDHYDYRRVMNGMVHFAHDDDEDWVATTFYDELLEGDRELDIDEQDLIIDTWANTVAHIRRRKSDPTSRWDHDL